MEKGKSRTILEKHSLNKTEQGETGKTQFGKGKSEKGYSGKEQV